MNSYVRIKDHQLNIEIVKMKILNTFNFVTLDAEKFINKVSIISIKIFQNEFCFNKSIKFKD